MNKGRLWTLEEIEANRKAYDENTPLHKEDVEKLIAAEATQENQAAQKA